MNDNNKELIIYSVKYFLMSVFSLGIVIGLTYLTCTFIKG